MTARVYIAAPLTCFRSANLAASILSRAGYRVVSTWHECPAASDPTDEEFREKILAENLAQLSGADVVVALCDQGVPRATLCEIGFAVGLGKPIAWRCGLMGEGRNICDSHWLVHRFRAGDDIVAAVRGALDRVARVA